MSLDEQVVPKLRLRCPAQACRCERGQWATLSLDPNGGSVTALGSFLLWGNCTAFVLLSHGFKTREGIKPLNEPYLLGYEGGPLQQWLVVWILMKFSLPRLHESLFL